MQLHHDTYNLLILAKMNSKHLNVYMLIVVRNIEQDFIPVLNNRRYEMLFPRDSTKTK